MVLRENLVQLQEGQGCFKIDVMLCNANGDEVRYSRNVKCTCKYALQATDTKPQSNGFLHQVPCDSVSDSPLKDFG